MESMESAITGGPVAVCATQSAHHQSSAAMASAMASLLPKGPSQCSSCVASNLERLGAAHAWREVMTQAEAACALDCGACGERVFPTTTRGAVALHGTKPEVQRPHELALWRMKRHAAVGQALTNYQKGGAVVKVQCKQCRQIYNVDYLYGQCARLQLRIERDRSLAPYLDNKSVRSLLALVHEVVVPDIAAGKDLPLYDWTPCVTCKNDETWLVQSRDALTAAQQAASRIGWLPCPGTALAQACVPLGVLVSMSSADLVVPTLASGGIPDLGLPDIKVAVMLVVKEAVAPLVKVSQGELKPLQGAPGLATLVGTDLCRFGSMEDCKAAAAGCAADAGIIVIAPTQLVSDNYPIAIQIAIS